MKSGLRAVAGVATCRTVAVLIVTAVMTAIEIPVSASGQTRLGRTIAHRPSPSGANGVLSAKLSPLGAAGHGASSPGAVIDCLLDVRQFPHYSSGDVSWHATWSCSGYANASGSLTMYEDSIPVAQSYPKQYGLTGNMNVRRACITTPNYYYYQGSAVVTFSAPGYVSSTVEGYSPTLKIACG